MPVSSDVFIRRLSGYSGARVDLLKSTKDVRLFVRKSVGQERRAERLRQQYQKQQAALAEGINTPAIIGAGESPAGFFFEMEYVPGMSAAEAIAHQHEFSLNLFIHEIGNALHVFAQSSHGFIPSTQFHEKIKNVARFSLENNCASKFRTEIAQIEQFLHHYDWEGFPQSACHGDFSMENVLFGRDGRVYFIDFDAPDLSSFFLDLSKLYQDLSGYWCLRKIREEPIRFNNASNLLNMVRQAVFQLCRKFEVQDCQMQAGTLLHLFRIVPYLTSAEDASFLMDRIFFLQKNWSDL